MSWTKKQEINITNSKAISTNEEQYKNKQK